MMFLTDKPSLMVLLGLLLSTMMPAQDLPVFSQADPITTGRLRSGQQYYLVKNDALPGYADFAWVTDAAVDVSLLEDLPHFGLRDPWTMLSAHGVGIGQGGYLSREEDGSIFRFQDIPLRDQALKDSTLLLLFDLMTESPQGRHAVIIAGDIDVAAFRKDLEMLSMLLPPSEVSQEGPAYRWQPSSRPEVQIEQGGGLPRFSLRYRAPRTAREQMATVLPYISIRYGEELGELVTRRLEQRLLEKGLLFTDLRHDFTGSAETGGDECWTVSVCTPRENLLEISRTLAALLAEIDREGVSEEDYADIRQLYVAERSRQYSQLLRTNSYYVRRCSAAFLRGADLADPGEVLRYFHARTLADSTDLSLFCSYASALLSENENLCLSYHVDSLFFSPESALAEFRYAWEQGREARLSRPASVRDTLGLRDHSARVRIKSEQHDPISGGSLWTASNGMKIVYRKADSPGFFHWGLLLKGGYALMEGLQSAEAGHLSDLLALYSIGGLRARDVANMLESNGIEMHYRVSLSGVRLWGTAPSDKLSLLLKTLISLAEERSPDEAAYQRYRAEQLFRSSLPTRPEDRMWAMLRPDDPYSEVWGDGELSEDLPQRADAYFEQRFSRMDDGVLALVGDLNEAQLRKHLTRLLGNFRTASGRLKLPRLSRTLIAGEARETVHGEKEGISMLISVPLNYTGENRMAAYMAALLLQRRLEAALVPWGLSLEMRTGATAYPEESFYLILSAVREAEGTVPDCLLRDELGDALTRWRRLLSGIGDQAVTAEELSSLKQILTGEIRLEMAEPETLVEAVLIRYADGKDVVSQYQNRVAAVTAAQVQDLLGQIARAPRAQYLVTHE